MSQRIVDWLEPIKVDEHEATWERPGRRDYCTTQRSPIGEAGQRIMRGRVFQPGLDLLQVGDIGVGANRAQYIALRIPFHWFAAAKNPDIAPVMVSLAIIRVEALKPGFLAIVYNLVRRDTAHGPPHR